MTKVKFESFQEAYEYQQNSRTDKEDPLFMFELDNNTGIESLDDLVATTDNNIVWLAVVDEDDELFTQYGVGRDKKWYSIQFNGFAQELQEVPNSLKRFDFLPNLVELDNNAKVIYENVEELFEVYTFLTTGKIYPEDSVSKDYLLNAHRMISFAKDELQRLENHEDACCLEENEDCCTYDVEWCVNDDEPCCNDENCCILEDFEFPCCEDEDENETYYDDEDGECACEYCSIEEEPTNFYLFKYGNNHDEDYEEILEELTENEASDKYNEIINMGFSYVDYFQAKGIYTKF